MTPPRVILYIGNFTRPWCTEVHFAYGLTLAGHYVVNVQENTLNFDDLPALVQRHKAHVVLWTRTYGVDNAKARRALDTLRAAGTVTASFHLDRFHGLDREAQIASEPFFATDLLFTPDDGPWADYGVAHHWLPPGVHEPECHGTPKRGRYPWDVVFVGSHPYPHAEWQPVRNALIDTFERAFGPRFAVLPGKGRAPVRGQALADLYATVPVVLGDSCLAGGPRRYWSDRIPETIGRGGYLIHPEVEGLADWYTPGVDLEVYRAGEPEQALTLAEAALDHDAERRDRIRAAGRAKVLSRDTYLHRAVTVMETLEARFDVRPPGPVAMTIRARWKGKNANGRVLEAPIEVPALESVHEAIREVWEQDEYLLDPRAVRGRLVLDIGANVGAFSVLAALAGARVHAYEPDPRNFALLERNIGANRLAGSVVAFPRAVLGEAGTVTVAGEGGGSFVERVPGASREDGIDADAIGDVIRRAAADAPIAFLKLDVEGAEYDILAGVTIDDLRAVEALAMEFHGPGMPHLVHLNDDGAHLERWGAMVAKLADAGRVETFGHPSRGGIIRWRRY